MNDLTRPISLAFSSQQDTVSRYASVVYTFAYLIGRHKIVAAGKILK